MNPDFFCYLFAGSMLHAMFSGRFDTKPGEDGSYFIDRDGTHFRYILNYLRTGELIVPDDKIVHKELLAEAKFYQVEGIIEELTPKPFSTDSEILSSNQGETLMNWLKNIPGFDDASVKLLYRASRNGWTAANFHSCCDSKGPTVTVIKSTGNYIFGGYTEQHWDGKVTECLHVQKVVIFFQCNAQLNAMQCSLRASSPGASVDGGKLSSFPPAPRERACEMQCNSLFLVCSILQGHTLIFPYRRN